MAARESADGRVLWVVAAAVLVWAVVVSVASASGLLAAMGANGVPPLVALGIAVPLLVYFRGHALAGWVRGLGLRKLTGFHLWRVAAAGVFFWYGVHGLLPGVFVARAAWGDLAVGLAAGLVAWLLPVRPAYWLIHVVGLLDLLTALGTAMILTRLTGGQMQNIVTLPVVLIPLVGVCVTAAEHVMTFDLLLRSRVARRAETLPQPLGS